MDVLHVTHQFAPETRGGVESYVRDLLDAQRARGLDAQLLTGSQRPWPQIGIEPIEVDGVPVHRLHRDDLYFDLHSKAWHPGVAEAFAAFLRRHRPRVVHVHQWIRLTCNLVEVAHEAGIPAVVTLHDFYTSCPRAFRMRPGASACRRPLGVDGCLDCVPRYGHEDAAELRQGIELFADSYRAEVGMADAVLVGVASTAELLAATTGLPRERFTVLPLGYRRRFPGQAPLPTPPGEGALRFAFWGGVARHKGVAELLEAFRLLAHGAAPRPVELHVLGGFATRSFEQQLRNAAVGLPVFLHGPFQTGALRELAPHVGVFPSTCLETFGLVLDECFELGLPCIVSDIGALAVRAGDGGLRARAGDPEALAGAMRRFLQEPELWTRLRAGLPAPAPGLDRHCDALDTIYLRARLRPGAGALPGAAPVDLARRVAFLHRQREAALARIGPVGEPQN